MIFDDVADWIVRIPCRALGPFRGFTMTWAIKDGRELEQIEPRLSHLETRSALERRAEIPVPSYRRLYKAIRRRGFYRDAIRLFRYRF